MKVAKRKKPGAANAKRLWLRLPMRVRHFFAGHPPGMAWEEPASVHCRCGWSFSRGDYP